jgi:hypothetical protein
MSATSVGKNVSIRLGGDRTLRKPCCRRQSVTKTPDLPEIEAQAALLPRSNLLVAIQNIFFACGDKSFLWLSCLLSIVY